MLIDAYILSVIEVLSASLNVWRLLLASITFMASVVLGLSVLRTEKSKINEAIF